MKHDLAEAGPRRSRPSRSGGYSPATVVPAALLALVLASALFAEVVSTHDPLAQNVAERLGPPSASHFFGTDGFGRDVFSRVVHGARSSLYVGFVAVALGAVVGVGIGVGSAYAGGSLDLVLQRLIDVLLGFPFLVLAIIVVVGLKGSPSSVAVAIALGLAPQISRVARASALAVKQETYILAARLDGLRSLGIIWKHLLPNSISAILSQVTGYLGTAVAAEATLGFLGLGVPPPYPSWGGMLQEGARQYLEAAPWVVIFPGLALSLTVVSFALLGDMVRDMLDSKG